MSDKREEPNENKKGNATPHRTMSEQEVQWELEQCLREFGGSLSDGLRYGFEGRGQELGDRAKGVGYAVLDAVNYGLSEAERALGEAQTRARQNGDDASRFAGGATDYSDLYGAGEQPPVGGARRDYGSGRGYDYAQNFRAYAGRAEERIRARAVRKTRTSSALRQSSAVRLGIGLAKTIPGGILAFGLLLSGVICLAAAPYAVGGASAVAALNIVGVSLSVSSLPFVWLLFSGVGSLGASGRLKAYAEAIGTETGFPLALLADAVQRPLAKVRKDVKKLIRKGWMTAWFDERTDMLYMTAEAYRAARLSAAQAEEAARRAAAQPQEAATDGADAQSAPDEKATASLETIRRFADVLAQEQALMDDAQGVEELAHMEKSTRAICEWLEAHPESVTKARRFTDYYVPTTLKLLHTYNEVKGQKGDNAENIRRDIAGILHTLNTAFDNLHDTLLSDMALDISGEIAALQGMLARDGLTGEGLL